MTSMTRLMKPTILADKLKGSISRGDIGRGSKRRGIEVAACAAVDGEIKLS